MKEAQKECCEKAKSRAEKAQQLILSMTSGNWMHSKGNINVLLEGVLLHIKKLESLED